MSSSHGKPRMRWMAAPLLVLACAAGLARADETYVLQLSGRGTHRFDAWECPMQVCTIGGTSFSWEGTVVVVVSSDASGTFAPPDFVSMTLDWTAPYVFAFPRAVSGIFPAPTVTVVDGRVTSIDVLWQNGTPETLSFSGLSVFFNKPPTHHSGPTSASAFLTQVPEPQTGVLLAIGLAGLLIASARGQVFNLKFKPKT